MNDAGNDAAPAKVFFLIYASAAVAPFSSAELLSLLDKCRENNTRLNVTGMLLYKDGNFMQLLEGEEHAVRRLYDKISLDRRHLGIVMFLEGFTANRQFPDWSMGFRDLNSEAEINAPGYSEFMKTKFNGEEFTANPTRAQKLLLFFKKSN